MGPILVVDATSRTMAVPAHHLEVREVLPVTFSLVIRAPEDPNPVRGTRDDVGLRYAVCPVCARRVRLVGSPARIECPDCAHTGTVAWEQFC